MENILHYSIFNGKKQIQATFMMNMASSIDGIFKFKFNFAIFYYYMF